MASTETRDDDRIMGTDAAYAVGRFKPDGPDGYRASTMPDAPLRATRDEAVEDERAYLESRVRYVVQVWNGHRWAKVRGNEGGPWRTRDRAEKIAEAREAAERRPSSTEGMPHRVVEVNAPA